MFTTRYRQLLAALTTAAVASGASLLSAQSPRITPRFYDDDPVARVQDTQDASKVEDRDLSLYYDAIINLFGRPGQRAVGRAESVNSIDEVPDSSWYVNRRPLNADETIRGVNDDTGPAPGTWTVSRKAEGASPGFTITDARGRRYFIKLDPRGWPELASSAEVVVTRLMHALGYHTAQTNIASVRREDLVVGSDSVVTVPGGGRRKMRASDIGDQLARSHRSADGTYRVVAGSALPGRPVGGFKYEGTRGDDPNDIVRHEDRRELRGLRVFSAWVNHTDAKAKNSLDTVVSETGRSYVLHNLIDFNATLGSAGIGPRERRDGYEYLAETGPAKRAWPAFGLYVRPWMTIDYPELPGLGRFEAKRFEPEKWRPRVPNPAYVRSRADDLFWGARKLMGLSEDVIRAAVKAGKYSDSRSEQFLAEALIERRQKILRAWLTPVNPIVNPVLAADGWMTFGNAAVDHGVAPAPPRYVAIWHRFDNVAGTTERIGETEGGRARLAAPSGLPTGVGTFVRVDLSAAGGAHPSWGTPVHAYFKRTADGWKLVGFERMPGAEPMRPGLVGAEPQR